MNDAMQSSSLDSLNEMKDFGGNAPENKDSFDIELALVIIQVQIESKRITKQNDGKRVMYVHISTIKNSENNSFWKGSIFLLFLTSTILKFSHGNPTYNLLVVTRGHHSYPKYQDMNYITFVTFLLGATLFLFASLRIYDHGRVIQMNMEIALILAHCCLLLPDFSDEEAEDIPMVSIMAIRVVEISNEGYRIRKIFA